MPAPQPPAPLEASSTWQSAARAQAPTALEPAAGACATREPSASAAVPDEPAAPAERPASLALASGAPASASLRAGHISGLDGLRAIAVLAVIAYHAGLGWLPGGFLGVEVFFVISGYLITALLLAERDRTGRIDVRAFWLRRARRLLPALFLLLGGVLVFAVVFVPGEVARLRGDALAAAGYVTNWYLIVRNQSYFQAIGRPSPLGHLWSLAVEEQFYVLWPLALVGGLALLRRRGMLVAVVAGAAGSALLMAALYQPTADPSFLYYGTDTRMTGLLLGAALAFVRVPGPAAAPAAGRIALLRRVSWELIAVAGIAGLGLFFVLLDESQPFLYLGGFAALAAVTTIVIAAVVRPGSRVGWLLDRQPLRWIGERSYSIYLWHWPVITLTRPGLDVPLAPLPDLALRLAVTLALSELSYRFVETPVRRGALGRAWQQWQGARGRRLAHYRWRLAAGAVLAGAALAVGAQVAIATAPPPPAYLALAPVQDDLDTGTTAGAVASTAMPRSSPDEAVARTPPAPAPLPSPTPGGPPATGAARPAPGGEDATAAAPTPGQPPTGGTTGSPGTGIDPTATPATTAPATTTPAATTPLPIVPAAAATPANSRVFALGDSVMLGAVPELRRAIPGIRIDAVEARPFGAGIAILEDLRAAGPVPDTVIVALGDNGWVTDAQVDQVMHILSNVRLVAFVNLKEPRDWEAHDNAVLASAAARYANVRLIDWHSASENRPSLFWDDLIHLRPQGASVYASLVAASIR